MVGIPSQIGSTLTLLLCGTLLAQPQTANPDLGYDAPDWLKQEQFGAFAMDSYVDKNGNTILYTADFRKGNCLFGLKKGLAPFLLAERFGSGNASIGDLVVDKATGNVYVFDGTHGAIYQIIPDWSAPKSSKVVSIAHDADWKSAFGNGGIDINPFDGKLYLLTPGNSTTGGGIYRIDIALPTFAVTTVQAGIYDKLKTFGKDIRPDVIRFDAEGNLWGSMRDLQDLSNKPSQIYWISWPLTGDPEVVLADKTIGTVSDLEFDVATGDLFLAATSRSAVLRFDVDVWAASSKRTKTVIQVADGFGTGVQALAFGPTWGERGGHGLFVTTNASSHYKQDPLPSDLVEVCPFVVARQDLGLRRRATNSFGPFARGVLPGMIGYSMVAMGNETFVLGKTKDPVLDNPLPGLWKMVKGSVPIYDDCTAVNTSLGSGEYGRGDMLLTRWLFTGDQNHNTSRLYVRDEQTGVLYEVEASTGSIKGSRSLTTNNGAMAIGPDGGLWTFTEKQTQRTWRQLWPSPGLVDHNFAAVGSQLPAGAKIDAVQANHYGVFYLLASERSDPNDPKSRFSTLYTYDPVTGKLDPVQAFKDWGRINDFRFYERISNRTMPEYFVFGTDEGRIRWWDPKTKASSILVSGIRFPVTTLAIGENWHSGQNFSLFVMAGQDNPVIGEFYEFGPFEAATSEFLEPQNLVGVMPQGVPGSGNFVPFLRVENMPHPGNTVVLKTRWIAPDAYGMNLGTLAILAFGLQDYPGTVFLPGSVVPLSIKPLVVYGELIRGNPALAGSAELAVTVYVPPAVTGQLAVQALAFENPYGRAGQPYWALSNALMFDFK